MQPLLLIASMGSPPSGSAEEEEEVRGRHSLIQTLLSKSSTCDGNKTPPFFSLVTMIEHNPRKPHGSETESYKITNLHCMVVRGIKLECSLMYHPNCLRRWVRRKLMKMVAVYLFVTFTSPFLPVSSRWYTWLSSYPLFPHKTLYKSRTADLEGTPWVKSSPYQGSTVGNWTPDLRFSARYLKHWAIQQAENV